MKNPPVFIIGAGRSGTNMLRDAICSLEDFETWPCDEINYIWRHGNLRKKDDRFTADQVNDSIKKYIHRQFDKFEKKAQASYVVEKTCANTLKIPFISDIFPKAKYIFILRDGKDVAASAKKRWKAPLDIKYLAKKARFVPLSDLPYYGFRYLNNRLKKIFSRDQQLAFWGPIYPAMLDDLKNCTLAEVCAKQWKACVETAYADLKQLEDDQVLYLKYEDFVQNPETEIHNIMDFLELTISRDKVAQSVKHVSAKSIGNYQNNLSSIEQKAVEKITQSTMDNLYSQIHNE